MGFPKDYTKDKEDRNTPHEREQLLGNSMHTGVLHRLLSDAPFMKRNAQQENHAQLDSPPPVQVDLTLQELEDKAEVGTVDWRQEVASNTNNPTKPLSEWARN